VSAIGQQPDRLVQEAQRAKQLAEATAEAEVADAIKLNTSLAKSAPEKAVQNLKAQMLKVDTARDLGSAKRQELADRLAAAINGVQRGGRATTDTQVAERARAIIEKNRKAVDAAQAEAKDVQAGIAEIARLLDAGQDREARAKIAGLVAKYPDNAAVLQLKDTNVSADAVAAAKLIAKQSADGFLYAMNEVQRSAIPIRGDMEFAKDHAERMKRRYELNAPKLTAEEKKLIQSLDKVLDTPLKDAPFEEAVQLISTKIDQKIYIDKKSLEDTGGDLRKAVDVPGGVSARSALRVMLQSQNLTFLVRDNIIQVVSLDRAKEMLVSRAYDVRDLVGVGGPFNNPIAFGPIIDAQQTMENAHMLIDAIQRSVDPRVWRDGNGVGGGPATITFHYPTMSIIVRAPSEVHADLFQKMYGPKK
ncbi:MAG: hypothetical protein ABGY75_07945, partial [Gemmataceae bacterium]